MRRIHRLPVPADGRSLGSRATPATRAEPRTLAQRSRPSGGRTVAPCYRLGMELHANGPTRRNVLSTAFVSVTLGVVALVVALLVAGLTASALSRITRIPLEMPTRGKLLPAPAFLLLAVATDFGLIAVSCLALHYFPAPLRWGLRPRTLAAVAGALLSVGFVNALGAWTMGRSGESYMGMPEILDPAQRVAVLLVASVLAPLAEELFFREALLGRVFGAVNPRFALVTTSVLFGLLHASSGGPLLVITLTVMGLILGVLRSRTGSLGPPLVVHALNNLAAVLIAS